MKTKIIFISIVTVLLAISVIQILPVPPYADNMYGVYDSGYFNELDREFNIIIDSFLQIKILSRTEYAWIYLADIQKKHNISIKVFNRHGFRVYAPGMKGKIINKKALQTVNSLQKQIRSEIVSGKYSSFIPILAGKRCLFCHNDTQINNAIGVMEFKRDYDAHIYYSLERILIFIIPACIFIFVLLLLIKWEPYKSIKEIFDK